MKRLSPLALLFLGLAAACSLATAPREDLRLPLAHRIAAHTRFLSSDLLEGRAPDTRGGRLTAEYIAAQFALAGAQPAGEAGSFFQAVPLAGVETRPETELWWEGEDGKKIPMDYLEDFVVVNHRQQQEAKIDAEAVYVGHGIVAPEHDWNDYKDVDMTGKVAVLFTQEPQPHNPDVFEGRTLTYYGRWTYKYEEALRQGAVGAVIIHTTPTAGYPWQVVRNSWSGRNPYVRLSPGEEALAAAAWVTSEKGGQIVANTGKSLAELLALAGRRDFEPIPLGLRLRGAVRSKVTPMETRNVLARVEGSDPERKDEAVLYTAHWDHLGVDPNRDGDQIYNGAADNATGCGILLEIARAYAEAPSKPERSILFAAVGAEEGGLRGSHYYAQHPAVPAGKTAANLNFDGLLPLGPVAGISLPGYKRTTLEPVVDQLAEEFQLEIKPDPHPEQGFYYRSDHFSLARAGVPAFSIKPGGRIAGKPQSWARKIQQEFIEKHYHQPSDEYDPRWDFTGLEQLARFGFELGRRIAARPELPTWKPGDEFLAAREASWESGD